MKAVFFGEELEAAAPGVVGCLWDESESGKWITLLDVVTVLRAGQGVTIRQATEGEMRRASAIVQVNGLTRDLRRVVCSMYANKEDGEVEDALFNLHAAILNAGLPEVDLLDKKGA